MEIIDIAKICHEANKAYCECLNDFSQPPWEEAPDWQKESAINGVRAHMDGELTPEQSHKNWFSQKEKDGWVWGPENNPDKKEHPCMVSYDQLPKYQQVKDSIFMGICQSFK